MKNKLFGLLGIGLLGLTLNVFAANNTFNKQVNSQILEQELKDAGFLVNSIFCAGTKCTIRFGPSETKDPTSIITAHIYIDPAGEYGALQTDIRSLAVKLRANNITAAEKDRLLDKMLQHMGF